MEKYTNHKFRHLNHFCVYGLVAFSTFSWLYNHPHHPTQNVFIFPTWNLVPIKQRLSTLPPPPPSPCKPPCYFLSLGNCLPGVPHVRGILQHVSFCLLYFTEHHVLQVHRGCSLRQDFLLFLRWNIMHCADGVHFVYVYLVDGR